MEILQALNLEQLGTSAVIIAILIWMQVRTEERAKTAEERADKWQERSFDVQASSQEQLYESLKTIDKMMELAERGRV